MPSSERNEAPVVPSPSQKLTSDLQQLCADFLQTHIERLLSGAYVPREKVINDALWGSIRLNTWEVALLDSFLLQRLRYLRQLGIAHWIYPAAGHSRLEHSLGVLHQMEALLDGLERGSGLAGERVVNDVTSKLLRIAALVHDCGHALMSHVTEPLIESLDGMADLTRELRQKFRTRTKPSASEVIAAVFVQSPAFQRLLSIPAVGADFIRDVKDATHKIAGLILGGPVIPERAFLTLLVNGAHDADKLDYMPRDCMMAGVPCAVDVRRVIETIRCFDVPAEAMTPEYRQWAGCKDGEHVKVLALSSSGARALGEIAMTRTILYEKIYFHHKARVLETMVRRALQTEPRNDVREWLTLSDDYVVSAERVSPVFAQIRQRQLLKRAFIIAPPDSDSEDENAASLEEQQAGWRKLLEHEEQRAFAKELRSQAQAIATLLGMGLDSLSDELIEVDFPPINRVTLDQYAFVGDSVDGFQRASAALSGQRSEAGKRAAVQVGYVFAADRAVLPVFLATRKLLTERYSLSYGRTASLPARLDSETIATAEEKLRVAGYGVPLAPMPAARNRSHRASSLEAFLKSAWPRIEHLGVRFGPYQAQGTNPIAPGAIAAYLRQFEEDSLARPALRVLEAIDFKDRAFFVNALGSRIQAALAQGGVDCVCPLGSTGDSSAFLAYLMNDLPEGLRRQVKPLELALELDGASSILLWDDFCGAGGHACTALAQWVGLPMGATTTRLLRERLVEPLSPERRAKFS